MGNGAGVADGADAMEDGGGEDDDVRDGAVESVGAVDVGTASAVSVPGVGVGVGVGVGEGAVVDVVVVVVVVVVVEVEGTSQSGGPRSCATETIRRVGGGGYSWGGTRGGCGGGAG